MKRQATETSKTLCAPPSAYVTNVVVTEEQSFLGAVVTLENGGVRAFYVHRFTRGAGVYACKPLEFKALKESPTWDKCRGLYKVTTLEYYNRASFEEFLASWASSR
jgi:hypothetical protein